MKRQQIILTLFLTLSAAIAFGQIGPKEAKLRGEMYFFYEKYNDALPLLLKALPYMEKDNDLKHMLGVCYIYTNQPAKAEQHLRQAVDTKKPKPESFYYLGKALHFQQKFQDASRYYKQYLGLTKEKNKDEALSPTVKADIKRCVLGTKMKYKEQRAFVEQIADICTKEDEFAPIVSPRTPTSIYFTAKRRSNKGGLRDTQGKYDTLAGKPRTDIFVAHTAKGEWSIPAPLGRRYNSRQNDILTSFSERGDVAILYRSYTMDKGNLYAGEFSENDEALAYAKIPRPVTTPEWEGNAYLYKNNILFFSSTRKGGFGGKDLYYSMRDTETGMWSPPVNLGPQINSKYDEDTPFLAKDGHTLYFSSNNVNGIGGYDIFVAEYVDAKLEWDTPVNVGMPINSPGDDLYFRLDRAGLKGHFSSNREGGMGGQDIYVAYFNEEQSEQITVAGGQSFYEVAALAKPEEPQEGVPIEDPTKRITAEEDIRTYQFSPVYYKSNQQQFAASAILDLNQLAEIMVKYPQLEVELTAHTDDSGLAANNLFFTLKRGQVVSKYLMDKGVSPNQIVVKGCGSNYPQALNKMSNGTVNPQGKTLNRRVAIQVFNTESTPIRVEEASPTINPAFKSGEMDVYRGVIQGLSYKVQVKRTRQRFEDSALLKHRHTMIENYASSAHLLYTTGLKKRFSQAERLRLQLVQEGFEEAIVVPYMNGKRLAKEDMEKYAETYDDLRYYIDAMGKEANKGDE